MQKSKPRFGDSPNWYLESRTQDFGDYFGSVASLAKGETYLTYDKKFIIHRNLEGAVSVRRNACAHAGAPLLNVPGVQDTQVLRCPIHKWAYKPSGELIAAPHFIECKDITLHASEFGSWNGYLLGYNQSELDDSPLMHFGEKLGVSARAFHPDEFVFMGEVEYSLPYPRELMYINYFDGYHVPLYHQKTFDAVTDCSSYLWEFPTQQFGTPSYSTQLVKARTNVRQHLERLMKTHDCTRETLGWADFHLWLDEVMPNAKTPIDRDIFALWAAIYGNGYLMPELYEGGRFLAVSYLVSSGDGRCNTENLNLVEYYVHKSVPEELRRTAMRRFQHAYEQSAREDDEICLTLWKAHSLPGMSFDRVYHELLEAGDIHWRKWYRNHFVEL